MSFNTLPPLSRTSIFADLRRSFTIGLPKSRSGAAAVILFLVIALAITVFQMFAVNVDLSSLGFPISIGSVEVAMPIFYLSLIVAAFFVPIRMDLIRLALFGLFTLATFVSLSLQHGLYSVPSVMLCFVLYLPFIFYVEVREETYRQLMSVFLNMMVIVGVITLVEHATQIIWSYKVWPDLSQLLPRQFQFTGFNYIQPLKYGSRLMKPNAIFFLEVSVLSQWTAIALALELVFFARIWRMAFYAIVLVSCFAGTGLLLLALSGPVLLGKVNLRTAALIAVVGLIGLGVAVKIHWYEMVATRFTEYQKVGQSANTRFIAPIDVMFAEFGKPGFFFTGEGPGAISKTEGNTWWVVAKISYEYGIMPMITFVAYLLYVLFQGAPSKRMAFTYAVLMNFMGGFIIPIWPLLVFLLGGMFRIKETRRGSRKTGSSSSGKGKHGQTVSTRSFQHQLGQHSPGSGGSSASGSR